MPFLLACEAARSKFPYHAFVCHTRGSDDPFSSPNQAPAHCGKTSDIQSMRNECTGSFLFSVAERFGRISRACPVSTYAILCAGGAAEISRWWSRSVTTGIDRNQIRVPVGTPDRDS